MKTSRLRRSPQASGYIALLLTLACVLNVSPAFAAPVINASKDDNTAAGVRKVVGNQITYTITIQNTGDQTATGVQFADPDPANTTFVSVNSTPIARNDSYNTVGNVQISVPAANGLLANDNDPDGVGAAPALTVTSINTAGTQGNVTFNADGSFTFNPTAGFEDNTTFTYTITDNEGSTDTATVTIGVSGMIWFVNPNAGVNGDGRQSSPFNNLASFAAINNGTGNNPAAGDNIFLYESATAYSGGVTLLNNQKLIGQDAPASLATISGLTQPTYATTAFPATNPTATVVTITNTNASGNGVTLASGNIVRGMTFGNTNAYDIANTATATVGTLTIQDVVCNGTGGILRVDSGGTLAVTIDSASTTSAPNSAIHLGGANSGTLTVNGTGTLSGVTGADVLINGGTATVVIYSAINNTAGRSVDIQNKTSGTVSFNGAITDTGTGIFLNANSNVLTAFNFGLTLNTGANPAFTATNAGTLQVLQDVPTNKINTITTTTGTALNITNTTINASGVTFRSISSNGGTSDGIILDTTGTLGGLTVVGDGSNTTLGGNATGGTIANKSGADGAMASGIGIYLNNTSNVTLRRMTVNGTNQNFGVRGTTVTGLTMQYCTIGGTNGTNTVNREGSLILDNLFGTDLVDNCIISGSIEDNVRVENTTGTLTSFTLSNSQILNNSTVSGSIGFRFASGINATNPVMTGTLSNTLFQGNRTDAIQADASAGTVNISILNNTVIAGTGGNNQGNIGVDLSVATNGIMTFKVEGNKIGTPDGTTAASLLNTGINVFNGTLVTSGTPASISGTVKNNRVINDTAGAAGASNGFGIRLFNQGYGTMAANVAGNTVSNVKTDYGIFAEVSSNSGTANATGTSTVAVTGNTSNVLPGALDAIRVQARGRSVMNARINNNASNGGGTGFFGLEIRQAAQTVPNPGGSTYQATFNLEGLTTGLQTDHNTIVNYLHSQNPSITLTNTDEIHTQGITGVPTISGIPPLLFAPGGVETSASHRADARHIGARANTGETAGKLPNFIRAAIVPPLEKSAAPAVNQTELNSVVSAAISRWEASGLTSEQLAVLRALKFEVSDLPNQRLGEVAGDVIRVSSRAAGNGWFIGSDDTEFAASDSSRRYTVPTSPAAGRADLLTAIMHEMGHALGLPDTYDLKDRDSLMYGFLTSGERRVPAKGQAIGAVPGSLSGTPHFLGSPLNIGDLPAGKTVTITYVVTISSAATSITNQGTVSGTNIANKLTDDPQVGGAADATVTPVNLPPTVSGVSKTGNEDSNIGFVATDFTNSYSDPNNDALTTVRITALPTNGILKLNNVNVTLNQDIPTANLGTLTYTPNANYNGSDSFGWNGSDGQLFANSAASVNITVNAVNDAPTLDAIPNPAAIAANSGQQTVNLTGISAGPVNESSQTIAVTALSGNTALIPNPSVTYTSPNATGSLTYTPVPNAYGTAVIAVTVQDNGGTANGGVNTLVRNFTVVVNPDANYAKSATGIAKSGASGYQLNFIGNPGQQYTIQFAPGLPPLPALPNWQTLALRTANPDGTFSIVDNPPAGTTQRFYRAIIP